MMQIKEFLDEFKKRFFERLDVKSSWGRRQIKELVTEVALSIILEQGDKDCEKGKKSSRWGKGGPDVF